MSFINSLQNELSQLKSGDRMRCLRTIDPDGKYAFFEGKRFLNLSGNDYLGLAADNSEYADFAADLPLMTSSSSRLLTGSSPAHAELEQLLAELYHRPALSFNSGYHANTGILPALAGRGDLILCDKLNHASIIDGVRLSGAEYKRFPHLDVDRLEQILEAERAKYNNVFIVTESIFSMDGDIADIESLVDLKRHHDAVLIVDEAHSIGVLGENGLGLCEAAGLINEIDIIIGTFGKALASIGAFAITSPVIRDYLVNRMRTLIFTTALPPACAAWSARMLKKAVGMKSERWHLYDISRQFQDKLRYREIDTCGSSQIVPAILGQDELAEKKAAALRDAGYLVFPIRPPTVPPNTARLRFSLNAAMLWEDIKQIPGLI